MKVTGLSILISAALSCAAAPAFGQIAHAEAAPSSRRLNVVKPSNLSPSQKAAITSQASSGSIIPLWSYTITSPLDQNTYSGSIVGRNPYFNGHRTTTVPTWVVPVVITMPDGTVFDPTASSPCLGGTVMSYIPGSPVFGSTDWNINGTDLGTTQFSDAFQIGNFWTGVFRNNVLTPYHTILSYNQLPAVQITIPSGYGYTQYENGGCPYGVVSYDWLVSSSTGGAAYIENTLLPQLASQGQIGPTGVPIFIFDSVVLFLNNSSAECCAEGAHGWINNSSGLMQTYIAANFDATGLWDPDVSVLSDEVAKWMNDPILNNGTPAFAWPASGGIGGAACENIMEVGDPSEYQIPDVVMSNQVSYTVWDPAFFSWFYDQNPSQGVNGQYIFDPPGGGAFSTGNTSVCQGSSVQPGNSRFKTATRTAGVLVR